MKQYIQTAEFVTPKHPDKVCDIISDAILDAYLTVDRNSRVAVEVMGGHGTITVSGEISSNREINVSEVVRSIVGSEYEIFLHLTKQSSEIASGVDIGGAGDQGIMTGYATSETSELLPFAYSEARRICRTIYSKFPYDGKTQVTVVGKKIKTVIASFQNTKTEELLRFVKPLIQANEYLINPGGEWTLGGFDADSGLTGRKIVVDSYGPSVPVGGGAFSGKDWTKVDRSGAYMCRAIAVEQLKRHDAKEVLVQLAYAIGKAEPVMARMNIDGSEMDLKGYDVRPRTICERFNLRNPQFAETAKWGHFGNSFPWDG